MPYDKKFMLEAIQVANKNIENQGGPFGAVIVKNGEIIASSGNSVTLDNDPTAHAEVNTIRKACKRLGTFNLEGCEIYSSCEPCPMWQRSVLRTRTKPATAGSRCSRIRPVRAASSQRDRISRFWKALAQRAFRVVHTRSTRTPHIPSISSSHPVQRCRSASRRRRCLPIRAAPCA